MGVCRQMGSLSPRSRRSTNGSGPACVGPRPKTAAQALERSSSPSRPPTAALLWHSAQLGAGPGLPWLPDGCVDTAVVHRPEQGTEEVQVARPVLRLL